jgi:hypothetical protein
MGKFCSFLDIKGDIILHNLSDGRLSSKVMVLKCRSVNNFFFKCLVQPDLLS